MMTKKFRSTADWLREEGMEIGLAKGKIGNEALERFHSLLLFSKDFPDWEDAQLENMLDWR